MSNLISDVVLRRVAAAGDAGGCGGVGAFRAFSELGGKLGRVFAACHALRACAVAGLAAVEFETTGVVFACGGSCVWAGHSKVIDISPS